MISCYMRRNNFLLCCVSPPFLVVQHAKKPPRCLISPKHCQYFTIDLHLRMKSFWKKREKFSFYNSLNSWNKLYCNQTNIYCLHISLLLLNSYMFLIMLFCDIMEGAVIPASSSISGLNFWQKCAFQIQFGDSFMSGMWWYTEWYANTSQEKKD